MIKSEKAAFGAGCFWHVEEEFRKIKGVLSTSVGYMGGTLKNPTYKQVCSNNTGHAEAVQIVFDPSILSYNKLLDVFWQLHNPTTLNRQGFDIGTQYRSVIFYYSEFQKKAAIVSKVNLEKTKKYGKPIVTEIKKATKFYKAEEYHQQYLQKNKNKICGFGI